MWNVGAVLVAIQIILLALNGEFIHANWMVILIPLWIVLFMILMALITQAGREDDKT